MTKPRLPRRKMPPPSRTFTDRKKAADKAACRAPTPAVTEDGEYRANFLWPHEDGSIEEAGYEFANGLTEAYREEWWDELVKRIELETMARYDIPGEDE